jgi:pimeloyl-ACP methyl ester carboxylesterase
VRFFIWYRFLWDVSRIKLNLIATHPDRAGGLAFVGSSAYAFGPILFAQGAMLAGVIASRVLYRGENLLAFKLQAFGFVALFVFAILAPLLMFTPQMARAKRKGLAEYGLLSQRYVENFEQKWVGGEPSEELLGAADIQSLADLGNS